MQNRIFIMPSKPGLIVRDPVTGTPLEATGEYKVRDPYWIRRLKGGDVIAAKPPATNAAKKDKEVLK